jgi:AcrR family transcriptional regulator
VKEQARTRTRHGDARRAELLRHAESLFQERGYADTRMVDIARAAGVAKGLVYWYFENKEQLFAEIIVDLHERLRVVQAEATADLDDPLAIMYVGAVATIRFVAENRKLYWLIQHVSTDERFEPETTRAARIHADDTARVLEEGQRLGLVRADDQALVMAQGNAGVVGQFAAMPKGPDDIDEAAHEGARYVVRAVAASSAAADAVIAARTPRSRGNRRRKPPPIPSRTSAGRAG